MIENKKQLTKQQWEKLVETYENATHKKQGAMDCKTWDFKVYIDEDKNIYLSYLYEIQGILKNVSKMFIKFEPSGKKKVMNDENYTREELDKYFEKLIEIK